MNCTEKLIQAVVEYGEEVEWSDKEIAEKLIDGIGLMGVDLNGYGYSYLVSAYMSNEEENADENDESLEVCPVCGAAIEPVDGEEDGYGIMNLCWKCGECGTSGYAELDMQNGNKFVGHTY